VAKLPTQPFPDQSSKVQFIVARARQYGIDPAAVLAVWTHEGLSGAIGDNGTSFGPGQMHVGGVYDSAVADAGAPPGSDPTAANNWANSPAGIDYALSRIAGVARGLRGYPAINAIVRRFENPANPDAEVANAEQSYPQASYVAAGVGLPSTSGGGIIGRAEQVIGGTIAQAPGVAGAAAQHVPGVKQAESVASFLGRLADPKFLLRAGEVIAGAVLLIAGLYLLARQIGLAAVLPKGAGSSGGGGGDPFAWTADQAQEAQRRAEAAFAAGEARGRTSVEPVDVQQEREHESRRRARSRAAAAASSDIPF
jgi:hypothetical protein